MKIDDKLLNKLEKLSALKIAESKREQVAAQLSEIVSFVESLNELDLSQFEASANVTPGGTPLRADKPKQSDVIEAVLKEAPQTSEHFFIVPKIIE